LKYLWQPQPFSPQGGVRNSLCLSLRSIDAQTLAGQ